MNVLVTAASKHGSTAEIARAIATELEAQGLVVTTVEPAEVADLAEFDAVIIGSAVYAGRWRKEAREMVEHRAADLAELPVWLFSSGPVGDPPKPEEDPVDVAAIAAATSASGHRVFAGKIDTSRLNFAERAVVSALKAPAGDFRDWDEIRAWAREIAESLSAGNLAALR